MNTTIVVNTLARRLHKPRKEVQEQLGSVLDIMAQALIHGEQIYIPGLGTLGSKYRSARKVYNPGREKYVELPPMKTLFFHSSRSLKERVQQPAGDE